MNFNLGSQVIWAKALSRILQGISIQILLCIAAYCFLGKLGLGGVAVVLIFLQLLT